MRATKETRAMRPLDEVKNLLRGDYNSIRTRFFDQYVAYLNYFLLYFLRGRRWTHFIGDRLDRAQGARLDEPFQHDYVEQARAQFDFLVAGGLKPTNRVLDYGCGSMRTGVHIMAYTSTDNYVGADLSRLFVRRGLKHIVRPAGIDSQQVAFVIIRDPDLSELDGQTFDLIYSDSVLHFIPTSYFVRTIRGMRRLIRPGGRLLFNYPTDPSVLKGKQQFFRTGAQIANICESVGWSIRPIEAPLPGAHQWVELRPR